MVQKHEPGLWRLGDPEYDPRGFRKIYGGAYGHHPIGQVVSRKSRREEDYANALLITAAPELLASLKELLNRWHSGDPLINPVSPEIIKGEIMRARIAIDKAEGRYSNEGGYMRSITLECDDDTANLPG